MISDFADVEYQKDSGTPTLKYFSDALENQFEVVNIVPCRPPRKLDWFKYTRQVLKDTYKGFDLVYGAGCASTYCAAKIGKNQNIPSVGRLYGTYLYPYLNNPVQKLIKFEEVAAFKAGCTKYIVTNDGTRGDDVAAYYQIPPKDFYFWRNGVNPPDRVPMDYNHVPVIVSLARLEKWKHIERIIRAFNGSLYLDAKLLIVGDGPEKENLKRLANGNPNIWFTGQVTREQASKFLNHADIFVSMNDYSNVSNSLMEAMCLGKAILALNTGDTSGVIIHGENGLLIQSEDDLRTRLKDVVENPVMRTHLGIEAMVYAAENFESWDKRIQREVDVIKELVK